MSDLRVTRDGHTAVLTIDRPEKRNAMTAAMWAALPDVLAGPAQNPEVRVLAVTGAGPSFCADADISDLLGGADPADPMADVRRDNLAAQAALHACPRPTIAVIRGHCIGGGVETAASCDLRFADPTAVFGVTPRHGRHRLPAVVDPGARRRRADRRPGRPAHRPARPAGRRRDLDDEVRRFTDGPAVRSGLTQRSAKEAVAALTGEDGAEAVVTPLVRPAASVSHPAPRGYPHPRGVPPGADRGAA